MPNKDIYTYFYLNIIAQSMGHKFFDIFSIGLRFKEQKLKTIEAIEDDEIKKRGTEIGKRKRYLVWKNKQNVTEINN